MEYLISLMILLCWMPLQIRAASCDCNGTAYNASLVDTYLCGDKRLGPAKLPTLPHLDFGDYDRFGGLLPKAFLAKYLNNSTNKYIYPPNDGFLLDIAGRPVNSGVLVPVGTRLDRFGGENGMSETTPTTIARMAQSPKNLLKEESPDSSPGNFTTAIEAPYSQRALPPTNLNNDDIHAPGVPNDYFVYKVNRTLPAIAGPIAPWFGQPGLGTQFDTSALGPISQLLKDGYLVRLNVTKSNNGDVQNWRVCDTSSN